jgi:hypothetical protein
MTHLLVILLKKLYRCDYLEKELFIATEKLNIRQQLFFKNYFNLSKSQNLFFGSIYYTPIEPEKSHNEEE